MTLSEFLGDFYSPEDKSDEQKNSLLEKYNHKNVLGVELMMNCGFRAKCIVFRNGHDIDVQFEDGAIVEHRLKRAFLLGQILHPSCKVGCVGLRVKQLCGEYATCIAYRHSRDMDVQFDDGTIRQHIYKGNFERGWISKTEKVKSLVGTVVSMKCGMDAICIRDNGFADIDICFADGAVAKTTRANFLHGAVANPNVPLVLYPSHKDTCVVGVRKQMNCGFYCTVIGWDDKNDITVEFDDGCIVAHRRSQEFVKGQILHPNLGTLFGVSSDSLPQRLIYHYVCKFYSNVGYNSKPLSLRTSGNRGYELDIFLADIGVGIEFDGSVPHHFSQEMQDRKCSYIDASNEVKVLYVIADRDKRIVVGKCKKMKHFRLSYAREDDRLPNVYRVIKEILADLGNDVSSLTYDYDVISRLYTEGV